MKDQNEWYVVFVQSTSFLCIQPTHLHTANRCDTKPGETLNAKSRCGEQKLLFFLLFFHGFYKIMRLKRNDQ